MEGKERKNKDRLAKNKDIGSVFNRRSVKKLTPVLKNMPATTKNISETTKNKGRRLSGYLKVYFLKIHIKFNIGHLAI